MKSMIVCFITMICILFLYNCDTDFSSLSSVKSGEVVLSNYEGFDFSHDRIINFRNVYPITKEEKVKAIDLFVFSFIDTNQIRLLGPPIYIDLQPGFLIQPDSLNPSIANLEESDINQVSDLSNISLLPDIIFTSIEDILINPVFALKTAESNYAIFEITKIDTNTKYISLEWKYQSNGSTDF